MFSFLIVVSSVAQTDWQRWEKTKPNYLKETIHSQRDYSYQDNSFSYIFSKTLINAYWLFISDIDGDNCPFHPTCSSFFVEAIDETNLIQGTLMFFDRITRDTNPVSRENHYPVYKNFRYFDPPQLYTLNKDKIKYIPAGKVVY
uniref:Membrane protein insertion efficiency factor YidD n=1 Tax=Ignavibacterium album TaxID=591197 RepID=A0A7V2ZIR7_9BACT